MRRVLHAAAITLVALSALFGGPAAAQVTGRAVALGPDRLQINGQIFQLFGADAVEFHQFCYIDGRPWACGVSATRALQTLLDPVLVTCSPTGGVIGRAAFATCTSAEGDIAEITVRNGWALAERQQSAAYVVAEEAARAGAVGIWRARFVEPSAYREDFAAVERRFAERATEPLLAEATRRLMDDGGGADLFRGVALAPGAATTTMPATERRVPAIPADFIVDAIEPGGVFDWGVVARALETWRVALVEQVLPWPAEAFWAELAARPGPTIETTDAATYYAAITANAAGWIAAGRQPILLVATPQTPSWIGVWFGGNPPPVAVVTRKDGIAARGYLGTIDGIDVFAGAAPVGQSLLFADDVLLEIAYGLGADGAILAAELDRRPEPDEIVFRYSRTIRWSADPIARIGFPYEAPAAAYGADAALAP